MAGLRRLAMSLAMALALLPGMAAAQSSAPACRFQLGFATLHALIPAAVGDCLDNETYGANGDSLQHSTNGLLVWRKADNFTAFTDGYYTWVDGPNGLQVRLNGERFSWEANAGGLPVVASGVTGIDGTVALWPTMPVCRVDVPCSRPISATIAVTDAAGRAIVPVTAGADGRFRVDLPPGTYTLTPLPLQAGTVYPRPVPVTVTVTAGTYAHADVLYDTGIR